MILSFHKYDPGYSSRIPDLDFFLSRIQILNPGVKKAPDPDRNTGKIVGTRYLEDFLNNCTVPAAI
jgi:hypothetical protein